MGKCINENYRAKLAKAISQRNKIWYDARSDNLRIHEIYRQLTYIDRAATINPETEVTISDILWLAKQIQMDVSANEIISDKRWKRFEVGRVYLTRWDCPIEPERVRRAA